MYQCQYKKTFILTKCKLCDIITAKDGLEVLLQMTSAEKLNPIIYVCYCIRPFFNGLCCGFLF
nr:MAG TPA: hypothetical protein [Caudoviricetes sp.]